jgi:hypothetical protein
MKRDPDLIRKMVLAIEDAPSGWAPKLSFDGYTSAQVGYHAYLLVDGGLAKGVDVTTHGSQGPEVLITTLTSAGHDFAEAARDEKRWKKAMQIVMEQGGTITVDLLKQLLVTLMKGAFGVP